MWSEPAPRWELFDLKNDLAEKTDVREKFPGVARALESAYEKWWTDTQPFLVNEGVKAPEVNPFKALFWKQYGGGPDEALK